MIDSDEIARLYDRHARELLAFIYAFVRSRETAEDLLHDCFVRLIRFSSERAIDDSNMRALLYKIARNISIDHQRRERRRGLHIAQSPAEPSRPDDVADRSEMDEAEREIVRILESADTIARSVYLMRRESGMTYAEIARCLSISERTAKRKMRTMLAVLAKGLGKAGFSLFFFFPLACLLFRFVVF